MNEADDEIITLEKRHRQEKKELQAQIQSLKKIAKNDKTKKKELLNEIAKLETELESRHKQELDEISKEFVPVSLSNESEVRPSENTNEFSNVKVSKAQKRREKKLQQEKERAEHIKEQEKENKHGPRNMELKTINTILKNRNLSLSSIPSDGDCLYKAIAHQLELTRDKSITVSELRKQVADYIRQNKDDFVPFMTNPETFDMLNDMQFEEYCNKVENTKTWGGQLEIRALSNSLKCPINVIQATGPEYIEQGTEFDGPPLIITYHRHMYSLGEHYNSTSKYIEDQDEVNEEH